MHFGLNWALRLGVRLARELHLSRVIFEMDSLVVVSMINDGKTKITHLRPLLQDIVDMLQHLDWQVKVAHVMCIERPTVVRIGSRAKVTLCCLNGCLFIPLVIH